MTHSSRSTSGLDITMDPVLAQATQISMALGSAWLFEYQHSLRWLTRLLASAELSMVMGAMATPPPDPGHCKTMDPTWSSGLGPACLHGPGGSTDHPDQHGLSRGCLSFWKLQGKDLHGALAPSCSWLFYAFKTAVAIKALRILALLSLSFTFEGSCDPIKQAHLHNSRYSLYF